MKIKQLSLIAICFTAKNSFGAILKLSDQPGSQYVAIASDGSTWSCNLDRNKYGITEFQSLPDHNGKNYPIVGEGVANSQIIDGGKISQVDVFQCKKDATHGDECYIPVRYDDEASTYKIRLLICNKRSISNPPAVAKLDNNNKILPVAHPNK